MKNILNNFWITLTRFKVASTLNLLGLTAAFSVFMVIFSQLYWEATFNRTIKDSDRIYQLGFDGVFDYTTFCLSRPMGDMICSSAPDIEEYATQYVWGDLNFTRSSGDTQFNAIQSAMSISMQSLFDFKLVEGRFLDSLSTSDVIISQTLAESHFGGESPIGKSIVADRYGNKVEFQMVGIYEDFPENCHISNAVYSNLGDYGSENGSNWNNYYYLKVREGVDGSNILKSAEDKIINYIKARYGGDDAEAEELFARNENNVFKFDELYFTLKGNTRQGGMPIHGNSIISLLMVSIALLVIFVAVINYVNFYMAAVPTHIKAVNIKRIFGANVAFLRISIVVEAMMMMVISLLLSCVVVDLLKYTFIADSLDVSLGFGENIKVTIVAAIFAVVVGGLASLLPAFYTTKFSPIMTVKGAFSSTRQGGKLRTTLTMFQFIVSITLITFSIFVMVQNRFMKSSDYGFEGDRIFTAISNSDVASNPATLIAELTQNPIIEEVAFGDGGLFNTPMGWGRGINGEVVNFSSFPVSYGLPKLLDLSLIEGRYFTEDDTKRVGGTAIFNETAAKRFGVKIGDQFQGHNSEEMAIVVGIVKDFNFNSLKEPIKPICLYEFGTEGWRIPSTLFVKAAKGADIEEVVEFLRSKASIINPDIQNPDDLYINSMEEGAMKLYRKEDELSRMITLYTIITTLITLMGVLGMVIFEAHYRRREIALRKVHGATIKDLLLQINGRFVSILVISALISIVLAWVAIHYWVSSFAYQHPISWWIFAAAIVIVSVTIFGTITLQTLSVVRENPIKAIRNNN